MKILLVVGVVVLLAVVLYRFLRPVIALVRQFRKTIKHFQTIGTPAKPKTAAEKLVKCESCGIWIPESRALTRGSLEYCSRDCLKRAGIPRRKDTAA